MEKKRGFVKVVSDFSTIVNHRLCHGSERLAETDKTHIRKQLNKYSNSMQKLFS